MDAAPTQTLYVSNLYDKLKKEETRKCLYALFGQFGKIVDIVCMSTENMRGQAWVAFADIAAATNALRSMQEFPFFDKHIRVQYACSKSDAVARLEGTWSKDKSRRPATARNPAGFKQHKEEGGDLPPLAAAAPQQAVELGTPNRVVFVANLPQATNEAMLTVLFNQFPGFQQARIVPAKPGIAFVDFSTEMQAAVALAGLQGFKVTPQHALLITYAK